MSFIPDLPKKFKCPECQGPLEIELIERDDDGDIIDITVSCKNISHPDDHRWWQGEWQPVLDRCLAWAKGLPKKQIDKVSKSL